MEEQQLSSLVSLEPIYDVGIHFHTAVSTMCPYFSRQIELFLWTESASFGIAQLNQLSSHSTPLNVSELNEQQFP